MAKLINGKEVSAQVKARVAAETEELKKKGIVPGLAVILVGDDQVVARMAANDRQQRRYSGLRARLSRAAPEQEENHVSAQTTAEPALPTPMPLL